MIGGGGTGSSFSGLASYLTQDEGRVNYTDTRNTFERSERPDRVAQEMKDAAAASERVEKPVYHLHISWPEEDDTTEAERLEVMEEVLEDLGLDDRQTLIVEHDDAKPHVHAMVNRVQHDPYAEDYGTAWDTGHDWQKIEASLRRIEQERGWRQVPGKMAETPGQAEEPGEGWTSGQMQYFKRTEDPPLVHQVKAQAEADFETAESWGDLDRALREKGFKVERKGRGGVVRDVVTGDAVKLSSVGRDYSLGKLESRFGEQYAEYLERREEVDKGPVQQRDEGDREGPKRAVRPADRDREAEGEGREGASEGASGGPQRHERPEGRGERSEGRGRGGGRGATGGSERDEEAFRDAEAEAGESGEDREHQGGGRGSEMADLRDGGDDRGSIGDSERSDDGADPVAIRGVDAIAISEETDLLPGEPITEDMSESEQKEIAREWAREQMGSEAEEERDIAEIPTSDLRKHMEDLRERSEAAESTRSALIRVRTEVGEEPVGLMRRMQALGEEKTAAERRLEEAEDRISRRPQKEQELREVLERVAETGRSARGSREADVERARAFLKAGRLRLEIRDKARGDSLLDEVDKRMEASGLERPLEKVSGGWRPSDARDLGFGDAGADVLRAARHLSDATAPEYRRTQSIQHHREKARQALKSLSEEERRRVRDELMRVGERRRGENEYSRAEKAVRKEERVEAAQKQVGTALRRAEQVEGKGQIRRAEALDEAQEQFEEVEGPVQERVRESLEGQLEEALRQGRPSASDLRERTEDTDKTQNESSDQDSGDDEDEDRGPSRGYERGMDL